MSKGACKTRESGGDDGFTPPFFSWKEIPKQVRDDKKTRTNRIVNNSPPEPRSKLWDVYRPDISPGLPSLQRHNRNSGSAILQKYPF